MVAGLCEPKLLLDETNNGRILTILTTLTHHLNHDRKLDPAEESLRKALGYGWSVVIVATPERGQRTFEALLALPGKHVQWIVRENLKKNRLLRLNAAWVTDCQQRLSR